MNTIQEKVITPYLLEDSLSPVEYIAFHTQLVKEGKSTWIPDTKLFQHYTMLNLQRFKRVRKTQMLSVELIEAVQKIEREQVWLIIAETWCGDVAQNLPLIFETATHNPKVSVRIVFRDKHPHVMDAYLTNGSRAIPKLIVLDKETLHELGVWGPRPLPAQKMMIDYKKNPTMEYMEFLKVLQQWYNKDKGKHLCQELTELLHMTTSG